MFLSIINYCAKSLFLYSITIGLWESTTVTHPVCIIVQLNILVPSKINIRTISCIATSDLYNSRRVI